MTVGVFFKDGTNAKFEDVLNQMLLNDLLILSREPDVHNEEARIPRENIAYYVVNKDKEIKQNDN